MEILASIRQKAMIYRQRLRSYSSRFISLALCVSVLLLGACRKSSEPAPQTATEGNLSIRLNCLGASLRAGEEDPTSIVKSLDLYFFSGEDAPEKRTLVSHHTFASADLKSNAPLSVSLPVASYYMIAVLNSTPAIQDMLGYGVSWNKLYEPIEGMTKLYTKEENKITSVVWSNDQGPIHVAESAFASGAPSVQVSLTRTVSRIRLFGTPKVPQYMSIDLTNGGTFKFGNRARKTFLMRELAPLVEVSGSPMERQGDGSNFASRYAYSPGYHDIATSSESNHLSLLKDYRIPNKSSSLFTAEALKLVPKTLEDCDISRDLYYMMETTVDPNHATYYFLPSLLIGYKLYPASLDAITDFKVDEGWVSFEGRYYRGRDFTSYLKAILNRNKATGSTKPVVTVPAGYPQDLQAVCEEYVATQGDKMLIAAYPEELYPIDFKGLRYYLHSYNYYYLPIRHAPEQEGYGHYGVVRNNDYRIEITSISDYGTPLLLKPEDHPEEYKQKQSITSTITLMPLVEHNDKVDL